MKALLILLLVGSLLAPTVAAEPVPAGGTGDRVCLIVLGLAFCTPRSPLIDCPLPVPTPNGVKCDD